MNISLISNIFHALKIIDFFSLFNSIYFIKFFNLLKNKSMIIIAIKFNKNCAYKLIMWEKILSKKFDDIDIKLINILNKDGRINDQKIADILGISKTSVRMRRLKLQNSGAIKIIGLLVLQNMDLNYADILIKFVPNSKNEEIENFIEKCKNDEYIYEITRYIGYYDLLLRFFDEDFLRLKNHLYEIISNEKIIQEIIVVPVMMSDKAWGNIINFKDKK